MRVIVASASRFFRGLAALLCLLSGVLSAHAASNGLVIAQVYGAGGLSGANYRQDFITLFNPTSTSITASAYAIQIRSATSNAAFTVYQLPKFTLQPGQYYLITASSPTLSTYGATEPLTADYLLTSQFPGPASSTLNIISSTTQTIALTSSITPIPTGDSGAECPALSASNLVDMVGYGATSCFEGTNPAPDFSTVDFLPSGYTGARSTSLSRRNRCVNTGDNSVDFLVTPLTASSFQNSTTTPTPCPASPLSATATVSPGVVYPGSPILFTAAITAASGSGSTITSVSVNLQGIGGSLTQAMYDDGTHGDAVAGDGVYTISTTVASSTAAATHLPNVTVTDSGGDLALAPASFVVTTNEQTAVIDVVQAGAPTNSANNGVVFTVTGVVTGVRTHGFYLQEPDAQADSDPTTSEAIYVDTGVSAPPATALVGNMLQVTGVLTVVPAAGLPSSSAAPYNGTELDAPTGYSLVSTGNPLPTPVTITPAMDAAGSQYGQRYENQSMLVAVPTATVIAGTSGVLTESSETYTSNGQFDGVTAGTPRPFREPGLSVADPIPYGGPSSVQNYDGNSDALEFDSMALGGTAIDVTSGTTVSNIVAIDDYSSGAEELLISASARPSVGTLNTYEPAAEPESNEFRVASQNMERFYSSVPATGAVTLTTAAYQERLAKSSLSIRKALLSPEILAVQEMGTIASLTDLANQVNSDAASNSDAIQPHYVAYLTQAADPAAVCNGYLIDTNRVTVNSVSQLDRSTIYTDASGNSPLLFADPPLVLDATINATAMTAAYPVLVIDVDFASPVGETASTTAGQSLRIQRQQQAQTIAAIAQSYQAAGKNVIVAGDFGAPEFSNGVVDVVGLVKGAPVASSEVVLGASSSYAAPSPAFVDLTTTAPAEDRYSIVELGSAEAVDHVLVTRSLAGGYMVFAHDNVDFPAVDRNDATRPERNSDHDGAVAYFTLPALTASSSASLAPNGAQDFGSVPVNTASTGQVFTFTNTGNIALSGVAVSVTGAFVQANNCAATLAAQASCSINVSFTPTATGAASGTLTVTSSSTANPSLSVSLTGNGTTAPVETLSLTPVSADFGTIALQSSSSSNIFLLTNTGQTSVTGISIAKTGDYSETTSCGATLAPCSSCSINVVFAPTASGSRNGTLMVSSNTSTPQLTSVLTGSGAITLTTTATVAPTTQSFGTLDVGQKSAPITFTFTNTGTSTMTGIAAAATGDFAAVSSCGYFLNPGESCTVSVTFMPTASGLRMGTLNMSSGSVYVPSITTIATLSGNGVTVSNGATLSPTTADFGTLVLGGSSSNTFAFTNLGTGSLTAVAVSVSGSGFTQTNNCAATIAAGASCNISVVYAPTVAGTAAGTLTVTSSSTTDPSVTASLTGAGAVATSTMALTPTSQDFGSINVGATSSDFDFTVTNTGNTSVSGIALAVTGPFQGSTTNAIGETNCSSTLPPGASCSIILTFNPIAVGSASGTLTVSSSSTSNPLLTTTLTGSGVGTATTDTVTLTPAAQDFGTVTIGSVSQDFLFTFANTGTGTVSGIAVAIAGPFEYSPTASNGGTNCGTTLAAGATCTIDLVFAPTATGAASGMLTVTSSSSSSPTITSALTGTGTAVPAFSVTATTTTATVTAGSPVSFGLSVAAVNGYTGTVTLSCSGAPLYSSCQVSPASVTFTANTSTNLTLSITTETLSEVVLLERGPLGIVALLSLGLLFVAGRRARRVLTTTFLACVAIAMLGVMGCGSGSTANSAPTGPTTHNTPTGTYTYTVTATDGKSTQTLPFTVTVQ